MNAPNAADWLAAVGTVGAVLLGLFVLAREQRDRRKVQARSVNAWAVEVRPKRDRTELGVIVGMSGKCVVVEAHNSSTEPVYDFHAWVHHNLAPDSGSMGSHERAVLPPGAHTIFVDGVDIPDGGLAHLPYVDVTFRDTAGRRWQRLYTGKLARDRISREGMSRLLRFRIVRAWRRFRLRFIPQRTRVSGSPTPPTGEVPTRVRGGDE